MLRLGLWHGGEDAARQEVLFIRVGVVERLRGERGEGRIVIRGFLASSSRAGGSAGLAPSHGAGPGQVRLEAAGGRDGRAAALTHTAGGVHRTFYRRSIVAF